MQEKVFTLFASLIFITLGTVYSFFPNIVWKFQKQLNEINGAKPLDKPSKLWRSSQKLIGATLIIFGIIIFLAIFK